ncbi:hypothetical protein [Agrococcus beijingensis]|uniref:hypothetical protein n=1 Tax=Agrococcus beijingensis TaxID=3068634 RepID=UPI0027409135|nr:hypothetical protein [Agrococcus sp. REN33]
MRLSDAGAGGGSYEGDGTLNIRTPAGWPDDDLHAIVGECQESRLGQVDMVYLAVQRDPENLGEPARMVPCLQQSGLVDPSFTAEDYAREMASGAPSFDVDDARFAACLAGGAPAP